MFHEKANGAAMGATTEAMKELLIATDGEGRGLLAVEGAQPLEILTRFAQRQIAFNQFDDVDADQQVGDELLGDAASHGMMRGWFKGMQTLSNDGSGH